MLYLMQPINGILGLQSTKKVWLINFEAYIALPCHSTTETAQL